MGIFVLALTLRLTYLYQSSDNPSFACPTVDSGTYDRMATSIADGKDINYEFFWQPFLYPVFLSAIYSVSNSSILCAKIVQILLGSITCVLTYLLAKRIFNTKTGIVAGIITALYGPLIFFEGELLASGLAAFWSVALILLLLKTAESKNIWLCALLGISGALSIITRPTFAPFFVAGCIWLAITSYKTHKNWPRLSAKATLITAGFLLVALPVAIQNYRVTSRFGILPASGGINFYIGNNPDYAETLTARPGWGWEEITTLPERNGVTGDIWAQQDFFYAKVKHFITTQPLLFIKGLTHKTLQFLNSREIPRNVDIYLFGKWSPLLRSLAWKINGFGFPFAIILPLAILGLISHWRKTPIPAKLFLLLYPLSIILVFVTARYRIVYIPILNILAAAGCIKLVQIIRTKNLRLITIVSIAAASVITLSTLPGPFPEELPNYEAELYANVAATEILRGQYDQATQHLNKSLTLMPENGFAYANLATIYTYKGQSEQAIKFHQKALKYKPDSPKVLSNLGAAYAAAGQLQLAKKHYTKSLEINPYNAKAHFNLGNLLLQQKLFTDAANSYKKAVEINPDYTKAYINLGHCHYQLGDIEETIKCYEKAFKLAPNLIDTQWNLAWIYSYKAKTLLSQNKIEPAVQYLQKAIDTCPANPA